MGEGKVKMRFSRSFPTRVSGEIVLKRTCCLLLSGSQEALGSLAAGVIAKQLGKH